MPPTSVLISKIQYNTFEPGEFIEEKERGYEETIALIENFPWEQQWEKVHIGLTCPSITLQTANSSYLKLLVYYNHKFILYYYDGRNLLSKVLVRYEQAYEDIGEYFNTGAIAITGFKKENTFLRNPQIHFISQNFVYRVDAEKPFRYISPLTIFGLLFYFVAILILITRKPAFDSDTGSLLAILFAFIFGGVNLILSLNYINFCRDKMMQLSKGAVDFKYGNIDNPHTFRKSDIEKIIIKQNTSYRCPWVDYTLSFLYMKDGTILKIPRTLLSADNLKRKIPDVPTKTKPVLVPYCNPEKN